MGVFTLFCAVCGGPFMNVGGGAQDRDGHPDPSEALHGWAGYDDVSGEWLNECVVLSAYVRDGIAKEILSSDDYGNCEEFDCTPIRWRGKEDSMVWGVPLHKVCFDLLRVKLPQEEFDNFQLLRFFAPKLHQCGSGLNDFNYGVIMKNWGQDYELKHCQQWLVSEPIPLEAAQCDFLRNFLRDEGDSASLTSASLGAFQALPHDVTVLIFGFLSPEDLMTAALVSRAWKYLSCLSQFWQHRFNRKKGSDFALAQRFLEARLNSAHERKYNSLIEEVKHEMQEAEAEANAAITTSYRLAYWLHGNHRLRNTLRILQLIDTLAQMIRDEKPDPEPRRRATKKGSKMEAEIVYSPPSEESESSDGAKAKKRKKKKTPSPKKQKVAKKLPPKNSATNSSLVKPKSRPKRNKK